jgi:cytochrome P450
MSDTTNPRRLAFLDLLLKEYKADPNEFPLKDLREEVDQFIMAGQDSTTGTIFWTCHTISQHPEIQKKLHEEIDSILSLFFA